jgi:hypothetical protein
VDCGSLLNLLRLRCRTVRRPGLFFEVEAMEPPGPAQMRSSVAHWILPPGVLGLLSLRPVSLAENIKLS